MFTISILPINGDKDEPLAQYYTKTIDEVKDLVYVIMCHYNSSESDHSYVDDFMEKYLEDELSVTVFFYDDETRMRIIKEDSKV
jgi:hypothetical protein